MRLKEIASPVVPDPSDDWVYHGTNADLNSIRAHGLVATEPGEGGWPEYEPDDPDEWDDYDPPIEAYEPRLFASVSPSFALQYGKQLLRLPASLPWEEGEVDGWQHLYLVEDVPAAMIQYLGPDGKWHQL